MSLFVDISYIDSISYLLRNFKRKADYTWNFCCPICGDSKKNKLKARGYIVRAKDKSGASLDGLAYKCHNCSKSMMFGDLVKSLDADIYKQYMIETFKDGGSKKKEKPKPAPPKKDSTPAKPSVLIGCPMISTLAPDHPARQYIENRKIPQEFLRQIYWCDDFKALADRIDPLNQFGLRAGEGRIVLPCLDRKNNVMAIQGRSLDPNSTLRYITIKAYEDAPKTYGMNRLEETWRRIYVVEGPFDSLFIKNCLAMAGSDIPTGLPIDKVLIVYDNEPTSETTRAKIEKAISRGYRVCIWPDTIEEKDINDMIKSGYKAETIQKIIDQNSYIGLEATNKLQDWKRAHEKPRPRKGNAA